MSAIANFRITNQVIVFQAALHYVTNVQELPYNLLFRVYIYCKTFWIFNLNPIRWGTAQEDGS